MGYIGRVHFEASRKIPNAQVVAVATSRPGEARAFLPAEVRIFEKYAQLIESPEIDAVVVAVPTYLHEKYTAEAAAHGKHILCEKPLALDEPAARRILAAAEGAGVILMAAQVLRFWPQYERIKELVQNRSIGSVRTIHAWRLGTSARHDTWFGDPKLSGGGRLDLQVHDADFIYWLLGMPEQVEAAGLKSARGAWDHAVIALRYGNALASMEATWLMPSGWPFTCGIRVCGDAACLEYEFRVAGNVAERSEASGALRLYTPGGDVKTIAADDEDMYARQLRYFADCVASVSKPSRCPPEETCAVMHLMDRCLDSLETGRPVPVRYNG